MIVLVTGATGSIGRRLVPALAGRGDVVRVVSRRPREARRLFEGTAEVIAGDVTCPGPWQDRFDGADAVVHLAGAGIAERRWTRRVRDLIETSRIDGTHQVVNALREAARRPAVLVSASGTSYYGDAGDEEIPERFPPGKGFLADVCVRWEAQARAAEELGVRTVRARIGVVLDEEAPFLRRTLPYFRNGAGATLGSGRQWMPWIHYEDCLLALLFALDRPSLAGAVNVVGPEPCTNREFTRAYARACGRPAILRMPSGVVRALFGGVADEILTSRRVLPKALTDAGFAFRHPTIDAAFDALVAEETGSGESAAPSRPAPAHVAAALPKATSPPVRPRLLVVAEEALAGCGLARESVRVASSRGCAVVLASDSDVRRLEPLIATPLLCGLAIVQNGAVLWDRDFRKPSYAERLDSATVAGLVLALRQHAPGARLAFEGEDWIAYDGPAPTGAPAADLVLAPGEVPPRPPVRMRVFAPSGSSPRRGAPPLDEAIRAIESTFWRQRKVTLFRGDPNVLTIASPRTDRGVMVQRAARRLGVRREETMALVACEDDLGLADWCAFSVAIAGAPEPLRRVVGAVLPEVADPLREVAQRFLPSR